MDVNFNDGMVRLTECYPRKINIEFNLKYILSQEDKTIDLPDKNGIWRKHPSVPVSQVRKIFKLIQQYDDGEIDKYIRAHSKSKYLRVWEKLKR